MMMQNLPYYLVFVPAILKQGSNTAGTAVTAPLNSGSNISTTYADGICHQEALELWHNYESACKFATKALDHAFGSALLDK